jgi:hypothetical protein
MFWNRRKKEKEVTQKIIYDWGKEQYRIYTSDQMSSPISKIDVCYRITYYLQGSKFASICPSSQLSNRVSDLNALPQVLIEEVRRLT